MAKFEAGMEAMLDMFVFETTDLLEKLDDILLRTEAGELEPDDIGEIFRIMHTVKGSAAMMGLQNMSKLAHALEDLFFIIREDPSVKYEKAPLYELLYEGSDCLKNETENISDESIPLSDFSALIDRIHAFAEVMKGGAPAAAAREEQPQEEANGAALLFDDKDEADVFVFKVVYESTCLMPEIRAMVLLNQIKAAAQVIKTLPDDLDSDDASDAVASDGFYIKLKTDNTDNMLDMLEAGINVQSAQVVARPEKKPAPKPAPAPAAVSPPPEKAPAPAKAAAAKKTDDKSGGMISVKVEKLDRLMRLAQEIVIAQSGVLHSSDLKPFKNELPNFYKSSRELKKLTDELQDMVMSVRMVPINGAFSKMNRVIRDMNKTLGKNVTLVFEGENTEVDKSIADLLGDPLMHLVRNAVDHGIEMPEKRAAAGKTEPAKVILNAHYESNEVVVTVTDNGGGMDAQVLLSKAKKYGILTKPEQEYTEKECFELIMAPGFSTNDDVTEYSGRGVGMDVVKKNLEKAGGKLLVDSKLGEGSVFTIRVPMSLTVSDCMGFMLGSQEYAVPVSELSEIFRPLEENITVTPEGEEMIYLSEEKKFCRIIRLAEKFKLNGCKTDLTDGIMLLCKNASAQAALFADSVTEDMQIVIKPFSAYLARFGLKESGFSGTSVLGDGSIIPVIDANTILKGAEVNG